MPSGRGNAGEALVWADFNGDGFGDLAVGVPDAAVPFKTPLNACREMLIESAGEVEVFYGGPTGLTQTGAQRLFQVWDDGVGLCGLNGGIGTFT